MPIAKTPKCLITDAKIRSLKKTGKRYEIRDQRVPGFCVRVSEHGAKTFVLKTRYPGSPHPTRRALGDYGVMTLEQARDRAADWLKLIGRGVDPSLAEEKARQEAAVRRQNSFAAVAEEWFADKVRFERKGAEVEREFRREFVGKWPNRPVTEIDDVDVMTVIRAKKASAPSQARNLLGYIRRFFSWAIDQRVYGVRATPCAELRPGRIVGDKVARDRILSDDELFALWRAACRLPYPHGPVYKLLILTGLRLNEAADASRFEFDNTKRIWTIPAGRMKGKNGRARAHVVPLTNEIAALFADLPEMKSGPYLFSTTHGESPAWMTDKVKKRLDARMLRTLRALARVRGEDPAQAKCGHWTNHDIRRTVRSHLSRLKISEEAREAVLSHMRPGIKRVYDHHDYLDEKREALELWAARLGYIVNPPPSNVLRLHAMA
jgi:integrase